MKSLPLRYAAVPMILALTLAASYLPVPDAVPSTYVAALALVIGIVAVTLVTWRNALPTDTIGQLLQRTESSEAADKAKARSGVRGR